MKSIVSKSLLLLILLAEGLFAATIEELQQRCTAGGEGESCYELGRAYLEGRGTAPDETLGKLYIELACDSGVARACEEKEGKRHGRSAGRPSPPPPPSDFAATEENPSGTPSPSSVGSPAVPPLAGKLTGDFDGDGRRESVGWTPFASGSEGTYYQLLFFDEDGQLLWRGPRVRSDSNPLVALSLDTGVAMPELAADTDRDGREELLIPQPQSDVSPQYYRRLRWNGLKLEPMAGAALMMERPRSGRFLWVRTAEAGGTWVSSMRREGSGAILAEVTRLSPDGSRAQHGRALLRLVPGGAVVERWEEPLRFPASRTPVERGGSYIARLGRADHYNSRGVRLRRMIDILRQDRANYHRLGIADREDGDDPWFASLGARERMSRMRIVPIGIGYRQLRDAILYGTPLVEVAPSGDALMVRLLER